MPAEALPVVTAGPHPPRRDAARHPLPQCGRGV